VASDIPAPNAIDEGLPPMLIMDILYQPSAQAREALCVARDSGVLWLAAQFAFQFKNSLILSAARDL
jgi:hypothetical protein